MFSINSMGSRFDDDDHDWLITRIDLPPIENVLDGEPLTEFVCPPFVPSRRFSQRYTRLMNSLTEGKLVNDWEKKLILARLKPTLPFVEEEFEDRLRAVNERNTEQYIGYVQDRAASLADQKSEKARLEYAEEDAKRSIAFARYRNLTSILRDETKMKRARKWKTIIVSHLFLTALMKERRVHEASEKISSMLVPVVRARLAIRRKREEAARLTAEHVSDIPFPTPAVIQSMSGTFFKGWPSHLLEMLAKKARPRFLRQNTFLMHEGDVDRVMYMITVGTISIIINDRTKGKQRTKACSKACFTLSPPCYVGEFALVCKEPRTASIQCETDVGFWTVSPDDYEEVAQLLSSAVKSQQREATDVRRRANLQRFFPLRVEFLRHFPYFEKFSAAALNQIISAVEPIVLHNGDALFSKGDKDSSAYFIQDGVAILWEEGGGRRHIPRGSCVGICECACSVNERKKCSIISQNYCDIWRLRRDVLLDVGMSEPAAFLYCRNAAKSYRASEVVKPTTAPVSLRKDPYILFCLTRPLINRLWEASSPVIYLNDEKLVIQGQPFQQFIILYCGTFETTFSSASGETHTARITVQKDVANVEVLAESDNGNQYQGSVSPTNMFFSLVLGAYEYAVEMTQYYSTVTSHGLSEAFVVDRAQLDSLVPPEIKAFMSSDKKARELVYRSQKDHDAGILSANMHLSFASSYRKAKEPQPKADKTRA